MVWDLDPTLLKMGPLEIRYYGILFAMVLLGGFYFWQRTMKRRGWPEDVVYDYFYWMTILGILGARFGHCLFYEPEKYLMHPLEMLKIWNGGLASHGGTIGLLLGTIIYSRIKKVPILVVTDNTAFAAAIASTLVRIGNFFNSEIVGRVTDVPWAMKFPRSVHHDMLPRHPSQLYEALMGAAVFLVIYLVDRKFKERRPRGLLAGLFLVIYFFGRFMVEFVKEYQTLDASSVLTMGQYLSIPFFLLGWVFLYFAWRDRGRLTGQLPPDYAPGYDPETGKSVEPSRNAAKKKNRKKKR
jgi:prolipoprotein diacylglyceryl transferase